MHENLNNSNNLFKSIQQSYFSNAALSFYLLYFPVKKARYKDVSLVRWQSSRKFNISKCRDNFFNIFIFRLSISYSSIIRYTSTVLYNCFRRCNVPQRTSPFLTLFFLVNLLAKHFVIAPVHFLAVWVTIIYVLKYITIKY